MSRERFAQAYQRGFDLTVRFLLSRGVQRDDAKEVAQAAWVRGWERLDQLRNESLVTTWVNTIALNVYRSLIRREPMNEALLEQHGRSVGIDLAAIDIARVLTLCRPCDRSLLEQCINGFTTAEIAREQGVSETAIRIRLLRARRDARSRAEKKKSALRRAHGGFQMLKQAAA
jgi:DNA-directed RNA polymerase specialized sigma24 family protein